MKGQFGRAAREKFHLLISVGRGGLRRMTKMVAALSLV
jgi:hypothetical protein